MFALWSILMFTTQLGANQHLLIKLETDSASLCLLDKVLVVNRPVSL